MKTNRKAEYRGRHRIVSRPNGLWAVQYDSERKSTKVADPWVDRMGASKLSYEQAAARLNLEEPK